jgi:hypothetical protein
LTENILAGAWNLPHDVIVVCRSTEKMYLVIDTLPFGNDSIEWISMYQPRFQAFLSAAQIINIARMGEVLRIELIVYATIH